MMRNTVESVGYAVTFSFDCLAEYYRHGTLTFQSRSDMVGEGTAQLNREIEVAWWQISCHK